MKTSSKTSLIALTIISTVTGSYAAGTASDTSANYTAGWGVSTTPNNGSGFGAWSVADNAGSSGPYAGTYLDLSSYNNAGDTVLTGGSSWGTYANGGSGNGYIDLTRNFSAGASGSSSLYNQTFSFALSSGGIGNSGSSVSAMIGTAFNLSYAGGGADNFTLSVDGGAANAVAVNYSQLAAGLNVSLAVSGALNSMAEGYSLTISPFAGGTAIYSTSGTFDSSAFNTSSFTFADNNTASNQYFNNLNITAESAVPEPRSLAMVAGGLAALLGFRRR